MLRRLKSIMFFAACCAACTLMAQAPDNEAPGQILGGSAKSPIKIEVFSDFQCPACRELYLTTITKVLKEYSSKDKVCVIYHEFPLAMHPHSREAARYSEAASRLGQQKLLLVMKVLFSEQAQWGQDGSLEASVSKALPEDFQSLKKLMQDPGINAAIDKEVQLGQLKDIASTPTMFISYSGKQQKVTGMVSYLVMKDYIDKRLK
jgi:protein-disulfide isomerase